jgi:hypothetical protein
MHLARCHGCGQELELGATVGRRDMCEECDAELHCCLMCRHYDQQAAKQCKEPQAEPPPDKDRANFCDFFELGSGPAAERDAASDARAAFDRLFTKR